MARYCHNCGSPLSEGQAFCGNCGTAVPSESAPTVPVEVGSGVPVEVGSAAPTAEMPPAAFDPGFDPASGSGFDSGSDPSFSFNPDPNQGFVPPTGPIFNTGVANKASGMAIASLVLGIISILTGPFLVGLVFGIIAIVLYVVSKKKYGKSGIGLSGMITGIVGTVISVITVALITLVGIYAFTSSTPAVEDQYPAQEIVEGDLVGSWRLDDVYLHSQDDWNVDSSVFSYDEASEFQIHMRDASLTFHDDGTFVLTSPSGTSYEGVWQLGDYYVLMDFDDRHADAYGYFFDNDDYEGYDELSIADSMTVLDFER